jgi:hypothetical protein
VSARNVDSEEEVIFLRKRKRTLSREEEIVYKLEDDDVTEKTHLEMESTLIGTQPENLMESKAENDDELEDDIGSVSDYDENDGETPSRNVVAVPNLIRIFFQLAIPRWLLLKFHAVSWNQTLELYMSSPLFQIPRFHFSYCLVWEM